MDADRQAVYSSISNECNKGIVFIGFDIAPRNVCIFRKRVQSDNRALAVVLFYDLLLTSVANHNMGVSPL